MKVSTKACRLPFLVITIITGRYVTIFQGSRWGKLGDKTVILQAEVHGFSLSIYKGNIAQTVIKYKH